MESAGHTTTILNKIIVPVITTVLGATAIYFLGFNKKASASAADIEKATVNAWQSFVSTENISYKNTQSLSVEYKEKISKETNFRSMVPVFQDFKADLLRETKKLKTDIDAILKKDDNIDEAFVSMMKRTLDNLNLEEDKTEDFVDDLISIAKSNATEDQKGVKWQATIEKFLSMEKGLQDRSATEAEDISKALSKKYDRPFDLNDLLLYVDYKKSKEEDKKEPEVNVDKPRTDGPAPVDPNAPNQVPENTQDNTVNNDNTSSNNQVEPSESLLTGNWDWSGGYLELSANGDMYWSFDKRGYTSGDWKLVSGKIRMNATNPDTKKSSVLIGYLSNVTRSSFTMTFMSSPKEVYNFRKKN